MCFLKLGMNVDICIFPVKKYNIYIWWIKQYFIVPKYCFIEHCCALRKFVTDQVLTNPYSFYIKKKDMETKDIEICFDFTMDSSSIHKPC